MRDLIPEALVRPPLKSFLTLEHRREQLPEVVLVSQQREGVASELLGVYGLQALPPKRVVDLLDFLQSKTKLNNRGALKDIIKKEI